MSLTRRAIHAPQPATTFASPTQLSVDHKGERIAYGSGKSVFLRSIDDPSIATQYTGHTSMVKVARFSPSGYYVASGDASGMVHVWDCVGEEMIAKGKFHIISGPIQDLAWDGESRRIIAVGEGKERFGHCITFDTGNSVGEISGQSRVINSVSIRQQRPFRAATASDDSSVGFYHGVPFKYKSRQSCHTNRVQGVAFSPDGAFFVSVGSDKKIMLYGGIEGALEAEIKDEGAHQGSILSVCWTRDSKRFVTASADETVKLWDAEARKLVKTWSFKVAPPAVDKQVGTARKSPSEYQQVGVLCIPREDGTIISLSANGDLKYLSETSDRPTRVVSGHQNAITTLKVIPGKAVYTGSFDGRICRWDLTKGTAEIVGGKGHTNIVKGFVQTSSDTVASVAWDDHLRTIDTVTDVFTDFLPIGSQPNGIAISGNGKLVVMTITELRIYNPETSPPTLIASETLSFEPAALAVSPTDDIAVAAPNNTVHIFSLSPSAGISPKTTLKSTLASTALAYSPDGAQLAVGSSNGGIALYDAGYAKPTASWSFHTARITDLAWNPAGSHIASASLDTNLAVLNVAAPSSRCVVRNAHMGGANAVGWEDAGGIVSAGNDGTVKRWEVTLPV